MRLVDADALKEKKVYSHERHEKIVPVAEIDWSPTIDAIPVEWLEQQFYDNPKSQWAEKCRDVYTKWQKWQRWQKEQEENGE